MMTQRAFAAKTAYLAAQRHIAMGERGSWAAATAALYHDQVAWHGPHPLNTQSGIVALHDQVWQPLQLAIPDIRRRDDIVVCGEFGGGVWVASSGHYSGNMMAPWLGIAPVGRLVNLRFGEFCRFEHGLVCESYLIFDLLDLMRQCGCWPLAPSLGVMEAVPGPATHDGVRDMPSAVDDSMRSLALVEAMIAGLMRYDGTALASMEQERFWHPDFMWYGPAGIGSCMGHSAYRRDHQSPFLNAFPDRIGGDHKARLGDGNYVASTGWPSVRATHLGGGWLGIAPTGRKVGMRVMDFWRRDGDLLAENWVMIDILDLLNQMGVDVLARASIAVKGPR